MKELREVSNGTQRTALVPGPHCMVVKVQTDRTRFFYFDMQTDNFEFSLSYLDSLKRCDILSHFV